MPAASPRPLVAYSNRLPVSHGRDGWRPTSGGLVTALAPALSARARSAWVGWDGGGRALPRRVEGLDVDLRGVELSRREVDAYYHGFANRTLWPLLHGLVEQPVFDRTWWRAYRTVNERFAAVAGRGGGRAAPLAWVHDYHLMLVPALLRNAGFRGPVAFFLHVPFPAPELFARLPWRNGVLDGMLGADALGFHTEEYRENFARTCARLCAGIRIEGEALALADGRRVRTAVHPISIDAAEFAERATSAGVERCLRGLRRQFAGRRVVLGVDRLDYTKGILERLRSIELLLEHRSEIRHGVSFVQIAVPSRGEVREYRALREQVEQAVGRINGRFTEPGGDVPVHYLYRGVPRDRLLAYYRLADVCLVTPLRDGMNLVAKEFVVAQAAAGCSGALVLSEFAGAAAQLEGALLANPFDLEGLAGSIELALELDDGDRRGRIERMARAVHERDVYWWVDEELAVAERAAA